MNPLYGILHVPSGHLVTFYVDAQHDDIEGTDSFIRLMLGTDKDIPFLVNEQTTAKGHITNEMGYNPWASDYAAAQIAGDLKVVKIVLTITA